MVFVGRSCTPKSVILLLFAIASILLVLSWVQQTNSKTSIGKSRLLELLNNQTDLLDTPRNVSQYNYKLNTKTNPEGTTHVLLFTEGRSGSTWLSSFFWHRPDVYYSYEPLYDNTKNWKSEGCAERKTQCQQEIMARFWSCDFMGGSLNVEGRYPAFRALCDNTPNFCKYVRPREDMCRTKTHRVAKVIRLRDLNSIQPILEDRNFNVKIIHLVRDPRPLIKSRSSRFFGSVDGIHGWKRYSLTDIFEQGGTLCRRMLRNSQIGDAPPDWLKDRYVRIRHEDMSLRPIETAKTLYQFVGLEWNEQTEHFIHETTVGSLGKTGKFGIGHVSSQIVDKWKTMDWGYIETITDTCKDTIDHLGYESNLSKLKAWRANKVELFEFEGDTADDP